MQTRLEEYISPFSARYASREMSHLFSSHFRIKTFRRLWASLAKAQQKLGLAITHTQVAELEDNIEKIDFTLASHYEKKFRHDVMAHIHAFGDQCPNAKSIIHLGATSTYVTDNADLIQLKSGLEIILSKIFALLKILSKRAESEAATPCLGFTHYQPAQPTTIGKRISLWLQDFYFDVKTIQHLIDTLPFLGAKGATGTQSSFLSLFHQDVEKVKKLEELIAKDFHFKEILPIAGQTYTRKIDIHILNALESFAAGAHKMATDIRLSAHDGEILEGFTKSQVGSSAMPYKRNPIHSERVCGLARYVISLAQNPAYTHATQWLERSLDDSSNRRLCIAESFLGVDAILNLLIHISENLYIDQEKALSHLKSQLHHIAMENILMLIVKKGGDRQEAHEILRTLSHKKDVDLAKELKLDPKELSEVLSIQKLIGRAPDQVREFIEKSLNPLLQNKTLDIPLSSVEI